MSARQSFSYLLFQDWKKSLVSTGQFLRVATPGCGTRYLNVTSTTSSYSLKVKTSISNSRAYHLMQWRDNHFSGLCKTCSHYEHMPLCYFSNAAPSSLQADVVDASNHADIEEIVDSLLQYGSERDKMVMFLPKTEVAKQVTALVEMGLLRSDIISLHKYPEVVKNLSNVTESLTVLMKYGCTKNDIMRIVNCYPDIVLLSKEKITEVLQHLQSIGFNLSSVLKMIKSNPAILGSEVSGAYQRIEELKELFKTKDTLKLLEKSPSLLFVDMQEILQRFNYVYHEMGITQRQMMHSRLFSYPLEHIHARHMFLVRAGFFRKLKKKQGQIDNNPKLDQILDTSDAEFAKRFGNMSARDYQTFKKLLMKDVVVLKDVEEVEDDMN